MSDSNLVAETALHTQPVRTCFVAAPIDIDLKAVEKLLIERQMQPIVSADLSAAMTFLGGAVNAISTADLFLAVLSSERNNENVYLELGIAIAKERRILVVAPPDKPLLVDIAELPVVRADLTNHDAINFMLDQVLMTPPRKFKSSLPLSPMQKGQPLGDFADELQEKLNALGKQENEQELTELVMLALERSGYTLVGNQSRPSLHERASGPDLVVWSDEFGPWFGNPLLIEVKRYVKKQENWSKIVQQTVAYLQFSQTRSALILYHTLQALPSIVLSQSPPNIFLLSVQDLLAAMRTKSFASVMIDLRNRRVHGVESR